MSTPEEVAAELAAEQTRPDWLPENFKSPEDLAKSYEESRKEMDRLRSELDNERAQFSAALEQIPQIQQQQQYQQPAPGLDPQTQALLSQYQQAVEMGDSQTQLAITLALQNNQMDQRFAELQKTIAEPLTERSQETRDVNFQIAQDRVARSYGDKWDTDLSPKVQSWLHDHIPLVQSATTAEAFEGVIREAAQTVINQERAEQLAAFEADRAAKLSSQTATGSGIGRYATDTDEKKAEWEAVRNADVNSYDNLRSGNR